MPETDARVRHARGRHAAAVRLSRDTTSTRTALAEAQIAAYIEKVVAAAPPLADDQLARLRALLTPAAVTR